MYYVRNHKCITDASPGDRASTQPRRRPGALVKCCRAQLGCAFRSIPDDVEQNIVCKFNAKLQFCL